MNLSIAELHHRMRMTAGNEKLARPTISRILNDTYPAEPGASTVTGLAEMLGASTDYIFRTKANLISNQKQTCVSMI